MRTLKEVTLALKQASDLFTVVFGKPDDNELLAISGILISILLQVVKLDGTINIHKLFGVVATDEEYLATTVQAATFYVPAILYIYDDTIPADSTTTTCRRLEASQAAKIKDCDLYEVADVGC